MITKVEAVGVWELGQVVADRLAMEQHAGVTMAATNVDR